MLLDGRELQLKMKLKWTRLMPYTLLTIFTLPIAIMYLWLFLSSVSTKMIAGVIPAGLTLQNWRFLWENIVVGTDVLPNIWQVTWNTLLLAGGLTIAEVVISLLSGYALSRMNFPGRKLMLRSLILLHAFPSVSLLIAVYYVLDALGMIDTLWGVLIVKIALQVPMSTYIIKGFFDEVPWDVEWASLIDGCSRIKSWYQVVLPLVKPGIASIIIFSFLAGWSEFLLLYTFVFNNQTYTLATYINNIIGDFKMTNYGVLTAVSIFYMLPVLIIYLLSQKSLMKMNVGGGKQV
jgi:inositol-phosphate transport system permease protein